MQGKPTPVRLAASHAEWLIPRHGVRNRSPPQLRDGLLARRRGASVVAVRPWRKVRRWKPSFRCSVR
jgi:hypothetical protein